jgi:hypothetical protein
MREIRTYGATSGDWKRSYAMWAEAPALPANGYSPHPRPPRQSSTLPVITRNRLIRLWFREAEAISYWTRGVGTPINA